MLGTHHVMGLMRRPHHYKKIISTLAEVEDFVTRNKVPVKKGFICVDGRYKSPQHAGMLARPGGNFRGIMVLLALRKNLGLTVGQCVDRAIGAVESMGISFNMHTDEHADDDDLSAIGCGHIAKAADPHFAKMYHVDPQDVQRALAYLRVKIEGRKYYHEAELQGDHQEQGVLVISGKKYTVNHSDPKTGEMYFVFDKARDEEYTKKLFEKFDLYKLSLKEFLDINELQLNTTLKLLAKDLPIYEVNLDEKAPQVKFVATVK